jgi:hypothetical protein
MADALAKSEAAPFRSWFKELLSKSKQLHVSFAVTVSDEFAERPHMTR